MQPDIGYDYWLSFHDAMPAHTSFCFEDVTVHETSLGMSRYIFLHDSGVLVKKASQSIKVLMTEKTGSFVRDLMRSDFRISILKSEIFIL